MREYNANGQLVYWEDDATRTVYRYDERGVQVGDPVPYTPEQNAAADARVQFETSANNEVTIRDRARQALVYNASAIAELEQFGAGTAALTNTQRDAAIRSVARHQARAFRELSALIRLELRELAAISDT